MLVYSFVFLYQVVKNYEIIELYDSFFPVKTSKNFGHLFFNFRVTPCCCLSFFLKQGADVLSIQGDTKKQELLENPTKIEEIQEKKFIDRMRLCRILQSMQHTQGDTKERELLKRVVAVKECVRGGGRHLQDVIFKHW